MIPPPDVRDICVLACDYDRTLSDEDLVLQPDTVAALREVQAAGLKVLIVTGRDMPYVRKHLLHLVDGVVGENGCYYENHAGVSKCIADNPVNLRKALRDTRLDVLEFGDALVSGRVEDTDRLREALKEHAHHLDFVPNRDRVMVLPKGVDKAVGLRFALQELGVAPEAAAAAGDGENDLPFLTAAGYRIAVANAVPEVKALAHHVTREPGGAGVAAWIRQVWLPAHR